MKPVFNPKSWHLIEVTKIRRKQGGIVRQHDRGNLEVLRADANASSPQSCEFISSRFGPTSNVPLADNFQQVNQMIVGIRLMMNVGYSPELGQPGPQLLFNSDDRQQNRLGSILESSNKS